MDIVSNANRLQGASAGSVPALLQQNPVYFGAWAYGMLFYVDTNNPLVAQSHVGDGDDPTKTFPDGGEEGIWLLNCSATVYDIMYTYANGSLISLQAQPATADWGAFFTAPFVWNGPEVQIDMADAANIAGYTARNNTDVANIWARQHSKMSLAMSIGTFAELQNDVKQLRNSGVSVTRVPIIQLYFLLGFKLLYVVVVLALAIGVYCFTHPAEMEGIRAQLNAEGLAAAHFQQPNLVRAEVLKEVQSRLESNADGETVTPEKEQKPEPKVGLVPTREGPWQYALLVNGAWQNVKPIVQDAVMQEAKKGSLGGLGNDYAAWH